MGKKGGKKNGKGKNSGIVHKEAFQRMSYLYQVCVPLNGNRYPVINFLFFTFFLLQAAHSVLSSNPDQPQLARFYIHTLKTISKRLVLKMWV